MIPEKIEYSKPEIIDLLNRMKLIFEVARLVNVGMTHQLEVNEDNTDLIETDYSCYAVWNMEHRCENCVSAMAFKEKTKKTKFEFVNNDIYFVVAKYIIVENRPFMLELVTKIDNDETLFGAYGKEAFIERLMEYNTALYTDPLTKAYNRKYYDSQLANLTKTTGIAMIDVDHFKEVNDSYGHGAGDEVLKAVADVFISRVRKCDSVIRYGGDEFLIMFENIKENMLHRKLEDLRKTVSELEFPEYPGIEISISVGGFACDMGGGCGMEAVQAADELLYKAKQTRNTVCTNV